eukprot:568306-Pyramimonas_sp.AAC.1
MGLSRLADLILSVQMPKDKEITMSNWDRAPLGTKQLEYAAHDAWVGRAIYDTLERNQPSLFGQDAVRLHVEKERRLEDLLERQRIRKRTREAIKEVKHELYIVNEHGDSDPAQMALLEQQLAEHTHTIRQLRRDGAL